MRTLNLSGFKPADSLSVSVSQGALTAGPINVPSWGAGGAGGTGGTITINVYRSKLHVAPSSVRFSVDLSLSDFDTPGPTGDATYDARLHDIIYLWDFDDPGTWTAPVQNLAAHKNRNAGKGPIEANMYRTPGTYNPSVLVIEPSSGKTATARVEVVVTDPDVVFAGTKTICINPVGDGDFTGAPAGAVKLQVDLLVGVNAAWANNVSSSEVKRWLFKGGVTHQSNLYLGQYSEAGAYFGAYGSGRAILRSERRTTIGHAGRDNHCFVGRTGQGRDAEYWFVDLEGAGNFDPTTGLPVDMSGYDHTFLRHYDDGCVTMSNCHLHNFKGSTVLMNPVSDISPTGLERQVFHMDDCIIENCGGNQYTTFQAWGNGYWDTWWIVSGTRVVMDPDTWDAGIIRAPMRINQSMREIVKGCDIFGTETTQPAIKFIETAKAHGAIVNCYGNAIEGQLGVIYINHNNLGSFALGVVQVNAIIDGNILCASHSSPFHISSWASGITVRNNLFYVPNQLASSQIFSKAIVFSGPVGNSDPDGHVFNAPSMVYNNTLRSDRTAANNGGEPYGPPVFMGFFEGNPQSPPTPNRSATEYNNLVHMPYTSDPQSAFAPVSDTVLFTPRSTGWVNASGWNGEPVPTSHPEFAPLTSVKDTKPLTGSAALGAALSGDVSYMDITMRERPEPPSKGAWEAD